MCRPIYLSKSRTEKLNCMQSWNYAHLYVLNVFCVIGWLLAPLCYTLHVTLTVGKHAVMHQPSQAALSWARSAETITGKEWQNVAAAAGSLSWYFLFWLSVPSGARATGGPASKIISAHEDQVPPTIYSSGPQSPNSLLNKIIWAIICATMLKETEPPVRARVGAGARVGVGVSKTAEIGWKRDR